MESNLTFEEKEKMLSQICLRCDDIMKLTGFCKSKVYAIMKECRNDFNGKAGIRTDAITTTSLFKYFGTSLEEEIALVIRTKELVNAKREK